MNGLRALTVFQLMALSLVILSIGLSGCGRHRGKPEGVDTGERRAKPAKAEVVRTHEYVTDESVPFEDRRQTVIIKDSRGNELERRTRSALMTSHRDYDVYGRYVTKETRDTYVDVGDGKQILTKTVTIFDENGNPERAHLYSPEGKTAIASYSLAVAEGMGRVTWSHDVVYSKLPCRVYQYEGGELKEARDVPQTERGSELGKDAQTNLIFADDFRTVRAVLPVTTLSEPIKQEGFEISEVGFTVATIEGKQSLLPYVYGKLPTEDKKLRQKTVVYSRVPEEFKEAFEKLSR